MSVFTGSDAASLIELLNQELAISGRILELTVKQADLIAADDIDAFDGSLGLRQELIEKIDGLHQESDVLMQSYISNSGNAEGDAHGDIEELESRLRDIIAECAGLDEKNTIAAKEKAESYKERISKLNLSRKSMKSYVPSISNDPEMFDRMM